MLFLATCLRRRRTSATLGTVSGQARIYQRGCAHVADVGETGKAWTDGEIDLVITAYFDLLTSELRGERPVKAARVRDLQALMPARTAGSIERKFSNISAVLDERQQPWIDGYKPFSHYQSALELAVVRRLGLERRLGETMAEYQANTLPAPQPSRLATDDVLVPPPSVARRAGRPAIGVTTGAFGALQDFRNRQLGRAGEEWVVDAERESLDRRGRRDLADRVVWVANDVGDGLGYDIASFKLDGTARHIEVKTTNLGARTPFFITRWEVEVSKSESTLWSLYRVFDFRSDPRIYRLDGSVEESARLEPTAFVGVPR